MLGEMRYFHLRGSKLEIFPFSIKTFNILKLEVWNLKLEEVGISVFKFFIFHFILYTKLYSYKKLHILTCLSVFKRFLKRNFKNIKLWQWLIYNMKWANIILQWRLFYTGIINRARNIVLTIKDMEKEQRIFKFCKRVQFQFSQS